MRRLALSLVAIMLAAMLWGLAEPVRVPDTAEAQARPTLHWGSTGSNVRLVQWKLQAGVTTGAIDGVSEHRLPKQSAGSGPWVECRWIGGAAPGQPWVSALPHWLLPGRGLWPPGCFRSENESLAKSSLPKQRENLIQAR